MRRVAGPPRNARRVPLAPLFVLLATLAACADRPFRGVTFDPPQPVGDFSFVTPTGDTISTAPEPGRPTMVFFGYTHCPDVCPVTLADWTRVKTQLGRSASRVRWYFVSVDPERDTPEVAQAYAQQFDSSFVGLSGDPTTLADMQQDFSVASFSTPGATEDDYLVTHASQSFLVDDTGQLRVMYSFNSGVDAIVEDLTRLLR